MAETCRTCRFCKIIVEIGQDEYIGHHFSRAAVATGICRFNPPIVIPDTEYRQGNGVFPEVDSDLAWCGKYAPISADLMARQQPGEGRG